VKFEIGDKSSRRHIRCSFGLELIFVGERIILRRRDEVLDFAVDRRDNECE
jgi:hypothetical protein